MLSSDEDDLLTLFLFLLMIYNAFVLTAVIIVIEDCIEHRMSRWRHLHKGSVHLWSCDDACPHFGNLEFQTILL
jgi:hypothetical protein